MIIAFAGMQKQAKTPKAVSVETVFGRFGFWGVNSWAATSAARTNLSFFGAACAIARCYARLAQKYLVSSI